MRRVLASACLVLGLADVAWINLQLIPRWQAEPRDRDPRSERAVVAAMGDSERVEAVLRAAASEGRPPSSPAPAPATPSRGPTAVVGMADLEDRAALEAAVAPGEGPADPPGAPAATADAATDQPPPPDAAAPTSVTVLFPLASAALSPTARAELREVAAHLREHPDVRVHLRGGTDRRGEPWANRAVAHRRAVAVRDYLRRRAIPPSRIVVESAPPERLACGSSEAEYSACRRVDLTFEARRP